jgi:hypothetical protein
MLLAQPQLMEAGTGSHRQKIGVRLVAREPQSGVRITPGAWSVDAETIEIEALEDAANTA